MGQGLKLGVGVLIANRVREMNAVSAKAEERVPRHS